MSSNKTKSLETNIGYIENEIQILEINTDIINSKKTVSIRDGDDIEADEVCDEIKSIFKTDDKNPKNFLRPDITFYNGGIFKRKVNFLKDNNTYSIQLKFYVFVQEFNDKEGGKYDKYDALIIIVEHGRDEKKLCRFKYSIHTKLYTLDEMNLENGEYFKKLFDSKGIKISTVVLSLFSLFGLKLAPKAENIQLIDKAYFIVGKVRFSMSPLTYLTTGEGYYSRFNFKNIQNELNQNYFSYYFKDFKTYINETLVQLLEWDEVKRLYNAHLYFVEEYKEENINIFKFFKIKYFFECMWTTLKVQAPLDKNFPCQEFKDIITLVYEIIIKKLGAYSNDNFYSRKFSFGFFY